MSAKTFKPRPALKSLKPAEGNLYEAVARYVENGGGSILVIGGIQIQQWPNDPQHKYRVAISFLGKPPKYNKPEQIP